jgi:hypothetical protein
MCSITTGRKKSDALRLAALAETFDTVSEHATFPGPRRLTQRHIATLFKDGWQIRSIEHARFEVWGGLNYCSTVFAPTGIPHAKLRPI